MKRRVGDGCVHLGRPRFPHAATGAAQPRTVRVRRSAAAELPQTPLKAAPQDAVDDEVDGRVGRHDNVAEVVVVVVWLSARVGDTDDVDELIDKRRSLTDEENDDYDDHHLQRTDQ